MEGTTLLGMGEALELKGSPEGSWPISLEKFKMSTNTELQLEKVIEGYTHAIITAAIMASGTYRMGRKKYGGNCASGDSSYRRK